jgi:hypothetical protein
VLLLMLRSPEVPGWTLFPDLARYAGYRIYVQKSNVSESGSVGPQLCLRWGATARPQFQSSDRWSKRTGIASASVAHCCMSLDHKGQILPVNFTVNSCCRERELGLSCILACLYSAGLQSDK